MSSNTNEERIVKNYLDQLFRNPLPELMDDECMAVFKEMYTSQGDRQSELIGYEVRLNDPKRYVDCILCVEDDRTSYVNFRWVELDYESLKKDPAYPGECSFFNMSPSEDGYKEFFEQGLPVYAGTKRAERLGPLLEEILNTLPEGIAIKQIGCMDSRTEIDMLRLVIRCNDISQVEACLTSIGWPGDVSNVISLLKPYGAYKGFGINVDLSEKGLMGKLGIEVFFDRRNPILVDRILDHLIMYDLCLPDKAAAIKRWIRILPDGEPFLQTAFSYFKLVYSEGKFKEAKAYIGQRPARMHCYYPAYYRPKRADIDLFSPGISPNTKRVIERIRECRAERISLIRFYGLCDHEEAEDLIKISREEKLDVELVLPAKVSNTRVEALTKAGAESFLLETDGLNESVFETAEFIYAQGVQDIRILLTLTEENADGLEEFARHAEKCHVTELIIMSPFTEGILVINRDLTDRSCIQSLSDEQLERVILCINRLNDENEEEHFGMTLSVHSCFSPLKARLDGPDERKNTNRGVERGCEAGRSFIVILADGSLTTCQRLTETTKQGSIVSFWEESDEIRDLRSIGEHRQECNGCPYERRCLPCPALKTEIYNFNSYTAQYLCCAYR